MTTINVVGAGIAGSLVARLLRKKGHEIRVFGDHDPLSASAASSNLYVGSWLKKLGSARATRGIEVLESLFGDKIDQPFARGIADATKVRHVAQEHLLVQPDVPLKVLGLGRSRYSPTLQLEDGRSFHGPTVLCCGHRINSLFPGAHPDLESLVGHCALFLGKLGPGKSKLTMPLPYRHHKLYQLDADTIYFANSTALKPESYWKRKDELQEELVRQGRNAIGAGAVLGSCGPVVGSCGPYEGRLKEVRVGIRPVTPGSPWGELKKLDTGLWSINGGGKNGMVAYAALAADLVEQLGVP